MSDLRGESLSFGKKSSSWTWTWSFCVSQLVVVPPALDLLIFPFFPILRLTHHPLAFLFPFPVPSPSWFLSSFANLSSSPTARRSSSLSLAFSSRKDAVPIESSVISSLDSRRCRLDEAYELVLRRSEYWPTTDRARAWLLVRLSGHSRLLGRCRRF